MIDKRMLKKALKDHSLMSDEELGKIVGGYRETNNNLCSYGHDIYCPQCLTQDSNYLNSMIINRPDFNATEYHCNKCDTFFVYDADLNATLERNYYKTLVPGYM